MKHEIYTIDELLDEEECAQLIDRIESLKIKHKQSMVAKKNEREEDLLWFRRRIFDKDIPDLLWQKVKNRLPEKVLTKDGMRIKCIHNSGTAFYYKNRGVFDHYDADMSDRGNTHWYTILVYLNDNFNNGGTEFYPDYKNGDNVDQLQNKIYIKPKKGSAVIFNIGLRHKGDIVDGEKWGFMFPIFHA